MVNVIANLTNLTYPPLLIYQWREKQNNADRLLRVGHSHCWIIEMDAKLIGLKFLGYFNSQTMSLKIDLLKAFYLS